MFNNKIIRKTIKRFPRKELNVWLRHRNQWNHDDWLTLLSTLESQGFTEWTKSQEGRAQLGNYLEENKNRS